MRSPWTIWVGPVWSWSFGEGLRSVRQKDVIKAKVRETHGDRDRIRERGRGTEIQTGAKIAVVLALEGQEGAESLARPPSSQRSAQVRKRLANPF